MNRTKIEWCTYTWNPVTGCLHGCSYCYARRIARRFAPPGAVISFGRYEVYSGVFPFGFTPTFYRNRLTEPGRIKKPGRIFVCNMGDLLGKWVPRNWIEKVLRVVRECPQHTFIFLTKNPARYNDFDWPSNCWLGTTVESSQAASRLVSISQTKALVRFVSFEPLTGPITETDLKNLKNLQWVIIGAMTGPGAMRPEREWVQRIIDHARAFKVPVFIKDNLKWPVKIQEYPEVTNKCQSA